MSENYPTTTRELVALAGKELAKSNAFVGGILGAGEPAFLAIEMNRIRLVMEEVFKRLDLLEKTARQNPVVNEEVLLFGCEQARQDPLVHTKIAEYGGAMVHYMRHPKDLEGFVEVMENLRKVNAADLKILSGFRAGETISDSRRVDELVGYNPQTEPFGKRGPLRESMTGAFPSFRRLEGLGVLFLAETESGGVIHQIGPLSEYARQTAFLTEAGRRLIKALPA